MKKFLSSILALALVLSLFVGVAVTANAAETNVAKIGDTEYATLEAAIKAVPKDTPTTIYLLQDYTIGSVMVGHQKTQNITVDLGGHTLSNNSIVLTAYRNGTTLTVQNGTIRGNATTGSLRATYGGKIVLGEDLTIAGAGGSATLVYVDNGSVEIDAKNGVNFVGGKLDFKQSTNVNNKVNVAASIGRTYFGTLADAFATAQDGETITVFGDIAVSEGATNTKKVTLDLNGKTITGTDNTTKNFSLIDNRGTLTVTDEIGEGKITVEATVNSGWNRYSAVIANNPGGKLILESGTLEHLGGTDMAYGIDNLTNGKGTYAETVINGGTVKSTYRAIRQFLNGVEAQNILTINGGTIEGANKSVWMQDPSAKANTGTLTVADGATLNGDVYLTVTEGSTEWPVEVSIAASAVNGEVLTNNNVPAGYKLVEKNGVLGVVEVKPVVIGEQGFDTLAEAIEAAQNGDVIVLNEDISVDENDLDVLDGYPTFFKVEGKTITINLNGKTVYADASAVTDNFVVGVFSTAKNGHLTLTGNGTVQGYSGADEAAAYLDSAKGNKDYNYKFYTLLANYDDDCSIIVNGGNYVLDYAGDSLAYTSCNEGIVVNGGTFKLGNLGGIRNGMPWVFNARGQNIRHVVVNGGTFCADIQHQYYPFEVLVPKELALDKSVEGQYTIVDAVAYVNEQKWSSAWYTNNIGYATLEEAIDACEGVKTKVVGKKTYVSDEEKVNILVTAEAKDADTLVEALETGKNVELSEDVKIEPAGMSSGYGTTGINVKYGQTVDGGGNVLDIKGAGGTWDSGINTTGGTIKNIKVTGSFRGIFINHNSEYSAKVVLENVVIDGTTYTISCDQGTNKGLLATNCTFNGWTSYAATLGDAKFVNCRFGEGNGYAYCRPYAPTEFVGCDFEAGFTVDPRAAVTFENCTLDGVPLTAENVSALVTRIDKVTVK